MQYDKSKHCVYYHLVWSTKYRFKVLRDGIQLRVREITFQVCNENGAKILKDVVYSDHVHIFVSVPPKLAISDLMRKVKGRSASKMFQEFPKFKKHYWSCHFWGRGWFSTMDGAITKDIVLQYLERHIHNPTVVRR